MVLMRIETGDNKLRAGGDARQHTRYRQIDPLNQTIVYWSMNAQGRDFF